MSESIFKLVVERARTRIALRAQWTRFATARTHNNRICDPLDPAATRFCAYGAMVRAGYELTGCRTTAVLVAQRAARRLTGAATDLEAVADLHVLNDGPPTAARQRLIDLIDAALADG
ncbi:MAG: hypothetical protein NW223_15195 [Hyphomicrobiaceae bacterium]|nr:hypothetical protein [Hyphomicrobiaceae bacterium]